MLFTERGVFMPSCESCGRKAGIKRPGIFFIVALLCGLPAAGQSLSVLPVNILLTPGQKATSLTVTNQGNSETAIQIRAFSWSQTSGDDQLTPSDAVIVSPPLATIGPGATQVVRLILRQGPQDREATYRILVDQIPPPVEPGTVHIVLRMSIPIFAQPTIRVAPHLQFHIERNAGSAFLVAYNDGAHHEKIRDVTLWTNDGQKLNTSSNASPYILAGATRRWPIEAKDSLPLPSETLRLTAHADAGAIEQQVRVVTPQ
jgi:fimbrial chaperone protein